MDTENDKANAKLYAPASGAYFVLQWEKSAPTSPASGGYKGTNNYLSRATRYRMFKLIAQRDWGSRPLMVTLTSKRPLDAIRCSSIALYLSKKWKIGGLGHCIRIEFQRRKSAHLHVLLPANVSRETLIELKKDWLNLIGEESDKDTRKYGFHITRPKCLDTKRIMLYVGGHTIKADYQSIAPYPLRRWFWYYFDSLPAIRDTGLVVSRETLDFFRAKYTQNRPECFGGTLILDIMEFNH